MVLSDDTGRTYTVHFYHGVTPALTRKSGVERREQERAALKAARKVRSNIVAGRSEREIDEALLEMIATLDAVDSPFDTMQTVATLHPDPCQGRRNTRAVANGRACDTVTAVQGVSVCSTKDQFDRREGRRLALLDAMQRMGLPDEARKAMWVTYFGKVGDTTMLTLLIEGRGKRSRDRGEEDQKTA